MCFWTSEPMKPFEQQRNSPLQGSCQGFESPRVRLCTRLRWVQRAERSMALPESAAFGHAARRGSDGAEMGSCRGSFLPVA